MTRNWKALGGLKSRAGRRVLGCHNGCVRTLRARGWNWARFRQSQLLTVSLSASAIWGDARGASPSPSLPAATDGGSPSPLQSPSQPHTLATCRRIRTNHCSQFSSSPNPSRQRQRQRRADGATSKLDPTAPASMASPATTTASQEEAARAQLPIGYRDHCSASVQSLPAPAASGS